MNISQKSAIFVSRKKKVKRNRCNRPEALEVVIFDLLRIDKKAPPEVLAHDGRQKLQISFILNINRYKPQIGCKYTPLFLSTQIFNNKSLQNQ